MTCDDSFSLDVMSEIDITDARVNLVSWAPDSLSFAAASGDSVYIISLQLHADLKPEDMWQTAGKIHVSISRTRVPNEI